MTYSPHILRRLIFIYQQNNWLVFYWNQEKLAPMLSAVWHQQGKITGRMEGLVFFLRSEASLQTLTMDVLKSSEIEGEVLPSDQVRSSIARKLGMDIAGLIPAGRHVEGAVEMMLDATQHYIISLTNQCLFGWPAALFPTGRSGMRKIITGAFRNNASDDPMQVISSAVGKEKIHYEAPAAPLLKKEMSQFIKCFNINEQMNAVLKATIAHLWFITIHPFDDGNGCIARAIYNMQLTRAEGSNQRFYSMSAQIQKERKTYNEVLEKTQQGMLDITVWME